jgi:hypothetical protein
LPHDLRELAVVAKDVGVPELIAASPNSFSKNRCPKRNCRQSDSPEGMLQSGSIHVPPTGTNCPAFTFFLIRSYRSGLRRWIMSYWYACEQANLNCGYSSM